MTAALFDGVPAGVAERAIAALAVARLEKGREIRVGDGGAGLCVIIEGRVALEYAAEGRRRTIAINEEGDLLVPPADLLAPTGPRPVWRSVRESHVAPVDDAALRAWLEHPALARNLVSVLAQQVGARELAVAIALEPRVDRRVALKLRELAGRWGSVTPDGVRLDLKLTHAQLARMVGAVRESVTLAIGRLSEAGEIEVRDRTVLIPHPRDEGADS